jgi:hypothetical protein
MDTLFIACLENIALSGLEGLDSQNFSHSKTGIESSIISKHYQQQFKLIDDLFCFSILHFLRNLIT